ncbi:hypothetical protein HPB48_007365 [Haemaphysalis longicornis]|uniref:Cuticle protein n=1 Tax=Haemaphysalis longicornis TaxID=44386 RepID=A0A9J6G453_HAELO|nr:hypothetical protein HPB48_007365 [Haemaphysalis longicornis]
MSTHTPISLIFPQPPQPYSFSYDNTDEFGTRLNPYTDATGVTRTVKYTADADGFHATVETNEPGTKSSSPADVLYTSSAVEVAPAPAPVAAKPVTVTAVHPAPFVVARPVAFAPQVTFTVGKAKSA